MTNMSRLSKTRMPFDFIYIHSTIFFLVSYTWAPPKIDVYLFWESSMSPQYNAHFQKKFIIKYPRASGFYWRFSFWVSELEQKWSDDRLNLVTLTAISISHYTAFGIHAVQWEALATELDYVKAQALIHQMPENNEGFLDLEDRVKGLGHSRTASLFQETTRRHDLQEFVTLTRWDAAGLNDSEAIGGWSRIWKNPFESWFQNFQ